MTLNMILGQPCCICIEEDNFDLKGSETDVTGIPVFIPSASHFLMTSYIIRGIPKICFYDVIGVHLSLNLEYICTLSILDIVKSK